MVQELTERHRVWIAYVGVKEFLDPSINAKKASDEIIKAIKDCIALTEDKQFVSSLHLKKDGMFLAYASKANEESLNSLQEKKISWGTYHSMEEYKARLTVHRGIEGGAEPE